MLIVCMCLLFLFNYRIGVRVRALRVECLVAVHDRHEVLSVGEVDDVVGEAGKHYHALHVLAGDLILNHFIRALPAHLYQPVAADHYELLPFAVVPVLALGDARPADVHADLTAVPRMHELGETSSPVAVHLQVEHGPVFREVAEVGAEKAFGEAVRRHLRNHQRLRHVMETMEQVHDLSESYMMGDRGCTVAAIRLEDSVHAVKPAPVLLPLQRTYHLVHKVVDVQDFKFDFRVVDHYGKVICDVVAECGDGTVVVRTAPLAVEVRETVDKHSGACLIPVTEHQFLAGLLAAPVFGVAETSGKGGLNGAADHHRAGVVVFFEGIQKCRGEAEVPRHELFRVLRAVDARKVEHEVTLPAPFFKLLRSGVNVVFIDLLYGEVTVALRLAVADIAQLRAEVLPDEPLRSRNKYFHLSLVLSPDHLVHDAHVALDDLHHFRADVLVHVVRDRKSIVPSPVHLHCGVYRLQE